MKRIICVLGIALLAACSHEKKMLRKAAIAVEQSDFEKAVTNYDQILKKNKDSYYGNAGKGIVLSEYMGKHEQAIPYLEKALEKSPKKTQGKINNDLGISYHYMGNYTRALYFYGMALTTNTEDNPDYDGFLTKRIADCKYAMEHPEVNPAEEQWVKNVGKPVNTDMPEYSPVFSNGNLLFTSQRKDNPKEVKNGVDGRYFENMYISKVKDGSFTTPERYTLPNYSKNRKFNRHNESVISASADNKILFVYRDGKIYEANLNDSTKAAHKLNSSVNFSTLQNHACLSKDEKTIFFSSESDKGIGGMDIYTSVKGEDGEWSPPQLMGFNTLYNEDTPYMGDNSTLFFSSNGLPGYGGFDIYRTRYEDGKWSTPENLGQPLNSPGDDIYFALKPESPDGYYASSRAGGQGDMDIYQVHYVQAKVKECGESGQGVTSVEATPSASNNMVYEVTLNMPDAYEKKIRSYTWTVNNVPVMQTASQFEQKFDAPGTYTISSKIIVYCDTCTSLLSYCNEKVVTVSDQVAKKDTMGRNDLAVTDKSYGNKKNSGKNKMKSPKNRDENSKTIKENLGNEISKAESSKGNGFLSEDELLAMNWDKQPAYFEYNQSGLREEAKRVLDNNTVVLKANPNLKIIVNGYADSRGSEMYNKNLSAKRAETVKTYLMEKGVDSKRIISLHAFGEKELVNNCTDGVECSEEQHQANRRVELMVTNKVPKSNTITVK
ncbi:MAG: OmpA family protein [Bacteroidetes bacterium]|nr:OmpA family protein [Bacteroidota bacterium]